MVHHCLPELRHLALDAEAPVDNDELLFYNKSRPIGGPTSHTSVVAKANWKAYF